MLKGAIIFALGTLLGYLPGACADRALERTLASERKTALALASTAAELRHSSRKLRAQCPSRLRQVQPLIFTPGVTL